MAVQFVYKRFLTRFLTNIYVNCCITGRTECLDCELKTGRVKPFTDGVATTLKCKRGQDGTHTIENAVIHSTKRDLQMFMSELRNVCDEWDVNLDTKPRASLNLGTWSSYTEQGLRDMFPGCEVRITGAYRIYMSTSDNNLPLFEYLLQQGHPFVIETDWKKSKADFWEPVSVGKKFGEMEAKVTSLLSNNKQTIMVKSFFKSLSVTDFDCPSKIGDFPEEPLPHLRYCAPEVHNEALDALPFPRYLTLCGPMNLTSAFHWPDMPTVGPLLYGGHGSPEIKKPTNLHADLGDAANLMVYASELTEEQKDKVRELADYDFTSTDDESRRPGAIWHIFQRGDYEYIKGYLTDQTPMSHDPIQQRVSYLQKSDLAHLKESYGIEPITFVQRVGDVIVVPACMLHQVANIANTMKVAVDFVSPFNAEEMNKNVERIYHERNREDYLGVKRVFFQGVTRALRVLQSASEDMAEAKMTIGNLTRSGEVMERRQHKLEDEVKVLKRTNAELRSRLREADEEKTVIEKARDEKEEDYRKLSEAHEALRETHQTMKLEFRRDMNDHKKDMQQLQKRADYLEKTNLTLQRLLDETRQQLSKANLRAPKDTPSATHTAQSTASGRSSPSLQFLGTQPSAMQRVTSPERETPRSRAHTPATTSAASAARGRRSPSLKLVPTAPIPIQRVQARERETTRSRETTPSATSTASSGRSASVEIMARREEPVVIQIDSDGSADEFEPDPQRQDGRKRRRITDYTFRCKKCQETFDSHEECKVHFDERHKHVCETCGKVYKQRFTLLVHNRRKHGVSTPPSLRYQDYIENIPKN